MPQQRRKRSGNIDRDAKEHAAQMRERRMQYDPGAPGEVHRRLTAQASSRASSAHAGLRTELSSPRSSCSSPRMPHPASVEDSMPRLRAPLAGSSAAQHARSQSAPAAKQAAKDMVQCSAVKPAVRSARPMHGGHAQPPESKLTSQHRSAPRTALQRQRHQQQGRQQLQSTRRHSVAAQSQQQALPRAPTACSTSHEHASDAEGLAEEAAECPAGAAELLPGTRLRQPQVLPEEHAIALQTALAILEHQAANLGAAMGPVPAASICTPLHQPAGVCAPTCARAGGPQTNVAGACSTSPGHEQLSPPPQPLLAEQTATTDLLASPPTPQASMGPAGIPASHSMSVPWHDKRPGFASHPALMSAQKRKRAAAQQDGSLSQLQGTSNSAGLLSQGNSWHPPIRHNAGLGAIGQLPGATPAGNPSAEAQQPAPCSGAAPAARCNSAGAHVRSSAHAAQQTTQHPHSSSTAIIRSTVFAAGHELARQQQQGLQDSHQGRPCQPPSHARSAPAAQWEPHNLPDMMNISTLRSAGPQVPLWQRALAKQSAQHCPAPGLCKIANTTGRRSHSGRMPEASVTSLNTAPHLAAPPAVAAFAPEAVQNALQPVVASTKEARPYRHGSNNAAPSQLTRQQSSEQQADTRPKASAAAAAAAAAAAGGGAGGGVDSSAARMQQTDSELEPVLQRLLQMADHNAVCPRVIASRSRRGRRAVSRPGPRGARAFSRPSRRGVPVFSRRAAKGTATRATPAPAEAR